MLRNSKHAGKGHTLTLRVPQGDTPGIFKISYFLQPFRSFILNGPFNFVTQLMGSA